ncbi:hypothetical protein [Mycobacterium vicinigordonae]|uniref:Uncharacterized protein n=1 Tax=Mycobacterium vicinigordonae TaxID=1719132 RepID=A0A7D6I1E8_9MYCO|nr:hypothetical protein [Mycobacterium vicinigordonae]QLL07874.1 hypothetical protein H0P51_02430 [Mycobacterium vicinigordonae]
MMSPAELSRMIEDGLSTPEAWNAIRAGDQSFIGRYRLSEEEIATLTGRPTPDTFAQRGVAPLLAMWGSFICNPDFENDWSAGEYFGWEPTETGTTGG